MEINIFNNYSGPIPFAYNDIAESIADYFPEGIISLILVSEKEITDLNNTYRGINKGTDVLSFPAEEKDYLGDIFICIDRVLLQADEYFHSRDREFAFLLVHGLLHLSGYDHDNPSDEDIMTRKAKEILDELNYRRKNG